ncbi:hypothetical protein D3C85_1599570 [compost metagenome]
MREAGEGVAAGKGSVGDDVVKHTPEAGAPVDPEFARSAAPIAQDVASQTDGEGQYGGEADQIEQTNDGGGKVPE